MTQIRLWPGVALVVLEWLLWLAVPIVVPEYGVYGIIGALACGLAVVVWWLFFSRAPRLERWSAVPLMIAALALTRAMFLHPSIVNGFMGLMIVVNGIPVMTLALVAWAAVSRRFGEGARRAALAATVLVVCAGFAMLRTDGITGEGRSEFAWRWTKSAEQELLERGGAEPAAPPAVKQPPAEARAPEVAAEVKAPVAAAVVPPEPAAPLRAEWPGFRGADRNSVVSGMRINSDWSSARPAELWRRPIGPGWSSFAVGGGLLYTQEQRGDFEVVSCYRVATGEPVWTQRDAARFWESNAGAGPRGTPALHDGRVYSLGATGILNALDARTGAVLWTRNAATDTGAKTPVWGFTSSPLVVDGMVIVAASGDLAAYDLATGKPRWMGAKTGDSYSSPQLMTIAGVPQVLLLSTTGSTSVSPADGTVLWKHSWEGVPIVQPSMTADGGVLVMSADASGGLGIRRLSVTRSGSGWTASEVWTSRGLKPYFNDAVIHGGHAFGFDGSILSCIDLQDGQRKWKGGRYGHGQMLLLREQNLLLVLSEDGELALVSATPDKFTELARMPSIEGKTWNHPVVAGDVLLVRNGQEMAAFRMVAGGS